MKIALGEVDLGETARAVAHLIPGVVLTTAMITTIPDAMQTMSTEGPTNTTGRLSLMILIALVVEKLL
jgi:hypothetical protein